MSPRRVTIDLITHRATDDATILVAVAEGPWEDEEIDLQLERLERRLCDYVDAVVCDGMAETYPESYGKPIVIRLDSYGVPDARVRAMFDRFQRRLQEAPQLQQALKSGLIERLSFEYNWRRLPN